MTTVLDEFPLIADWNVLPLRALVQKITEIGYANLQPLSVYLDAGVVPRDSRDDNHNQLGEDLDSYQRVLPNDLVFNKLRTWQGGFGISNDEGIVSPAYIVCRPNTEYVYPKFLGYLLKSAPYLAELKRLSKWMPPSQFDISWDSLKNLQIRLPSIEKQKLIANYLDDLMFLIPKIDEQISLAQEFHRAKLDFLFQDLKQKFENVYIRGVVQQRNEYVFVREDDYYGLLGVRWYGEGAFLRETVLGSESSATKLQKVHSGDLIYNRLFAWKESFGVVDRELDGLYASGEFPMFKCNDKIKSEYLNNFLLSPRVTSLIALQSQGASSISRNRWKESELLRLEIPLPPIEVQEAINRELRVVRDLIIKLRDRKDKLNEYIYSLNTSALLESSLSNFRNRI